MKAVIFAVSALFFAADAASPLALAAGHRRFARQAEDVLACIDKCGPQTESEEDEGPGLQIALFALSNATAKQIIQEHEQGCLALMEMILCMDSCHPGLAEAMDEVIDGPLEMCDEKNAAINNETITCGVENRPKFVQNCGRDNLQKFVQSTEVMSTELSKLIEDPFMLFDEVFRGKMSNFCKYTMIMEACIATTYEQNCSKRTYNYVTKLIKSSSDIIDADAMEYLPDECQRMISAGKGY